MQEQEFLNQYEDRNTQNVIEIVTVGRMMTREELELAATIFIASHPPAQRSRRGTFRIRQAAFPGER